MFLIEYTSILVKSSFFAFSIRLRKMNQDCVNAAITSDALPQDTKAFKRESEAKMFCSSPQNPLVCDKEDRIGTFSKIWFDQERPTPRKMMDVGFFCMGSDDRVCCFYCGGRLFHWEPRDNPSYEHAKWFPLCEFVLKKQGVKYVEKLCQKHSDLH